jgi:2-keto-4-pentenoate hydratase/2-oxohepta-3-ene-1,7-dioic acid hydratase in catechol pathway
MQVGPPGEDSSQAAIIDLTEGLKLFYSGQQKSPPEIRDVVALAQAELLQAKALSEIEQYLQSHQLLPQLLLPNQPRLLAPEAFPPKIICLGLNYAAHAQESGREPPAEPIIFSKDSGSVIGPEEPVIISPEMGRVDPEAELAAIIAKPAKRVPLEKALDYIGGYTVVNDVTAREMQTRDINNRLPWYRSKGIDTFCPLGPAVVLTDEITDPGALQVEMRVNGEVRQQGNTADLIFGLPFLIHYISRYITLQPGTIIATGTPSGIAPVQPGDLMEAWVEKIGTLRNPVVTE